MRHLFLKPMLCILLAGMVTACESNWDDDFIDDEPAFQEQPSLYPQQTADTCDGSCALPQKAKEPVPLPVQGPCASWERGCAIKEKPVRTSFDIKTKRCFGRKGWMGYVGSCEVQSPKIPEEKLARTHCFRKDDWGDCY